MTETATDMERYGNGRNEEEEEWRKNGRREGNVWDREDIGMVE